MCFSKNMQEHDLSLLQTLDGQHIIYTPKGDSSPKGGTARVIAGMLQEQTQMVHGQSVEVVATHTLLSVRSIDLPEVKTGDGIVVGNQAYEIVVIRPSNEGIIELVLEKL